MHSPRPESDDALARAVRDAWSDALRADYDAHPRAAWPARRLPTLAAQWLGVHEMFRRHATALEATVDAWRRGSLAPRELLRTSAARTPGFLEMLENHHHAETDLAFPALVRAAHGIASAVDVLDRDHEVIAVLIARLREATAARGHTDADAAARDLDAASRPFVAALRQHLLEEEDIVVPTLIVHGHRVTGL